MQNKAAQVYGRDTRCRQGWGRQAPTSRSAIGPGSLTPAGVDELHLTVPRKGLGVSRQAGSVPAIVAWVLACRHTARSKRSGIC